MVSIPLKKIGNRNEWVSVSSANTNTLLACFVILLTCKVSIHQALVSIEDSYHYLMSWNQYSTLKNDEKKDVATF